ncbi:ArdC-like ssDNA-binding domain-containing protein [uncultured Methylobacterium sp.]|uniref:ArdC-like ssDNA-binding domain-containing protein n=1 Tax=uncultured Methylobacterium sp. TaxID=157278 RepID=UPI0035CB3815
MKRNVAAIGCERERAGSGALGDGGQDWPDPSGHVRKGEHGSLVVCASTLNCRETDEQSGAEAEREIPFMKGYTVFNIDQTDGLPARDAIAPIPPLDEATCSKRIACG